MGTYEQVRLSWYDVFSQQVSKFQSKLRHEAEYTEYKISKGKSSYTHCKGDLDGDARHSYIDIKTRYKYVTMKNIHYVDEQFRETFSDCFNGDSTPGEENFDDDHNDDDDADEHEDIYCEMYTPVPKQDTVKSCYQIHRFRFKQRTQRQKNIENLNIFEHVHLKKTKDTNSEAKSFSNKIYTDDQDEIVNSMSHSNPNPKSPNTHLTEINENNVGYSSNCYTENKKVKDQQSIEFCCKLKDDQAHEKIAPNQYDLDTFVAYQKSKRWQPLKGFAAADWMLKDDQTHEKIASNPYDLDTFVAHQKSKGWQPLKGFAAADWMSKFPEDYSVNELFLFLLRQGNTKLAENMKNFKIDGSLMKILLSKEETLLFDLLDCVSMNELKNLRECFWPTRRRCYAMNSTTAFANDYVIL